MDIVSQRVIPRVNNSYSSTLEETMEQQKDYFWAYIGGIIVIAALTLWTVKSSEHGKYETAKRAIAEDAANSAYLHKP